MMSLSSDVPVALFLSLVAFLWLQLTSPVEPAALSHVLSNSSISHPAQSYPRETF